ncbi:hypothetical protein KSC_109860 [Ktedonobacter sp. SOSP1-52]|nr:hypothetical protein KSC_109860 [Ktedonobacter sp. SOSP1-52]
MCMEQATMLILLQNLERDWQAKACIYGWRRTLLFFLGWQAYLDGGRILRGRNLAEYQEKGSDDGF